METLRVLVVDDEPGIRLGTARVLQNYRFCIPDLADEVAFEISQGASGEEALELVASLAPDILLLDHKLPGISGIEVLERLGQQKRDVLTVMITAYATIETAVQATKCGAHDFLAKPFTPEELKSTIYKASKHLILQRQARRLAQEKRLVRFQFISVLAHELKAPLAAVEGYIGIIRDGVVKPDSPKAQEILDRSIERIGGMRKLILDLLDLTRIESGQKKRELAEVDVREVAARAIETLVPIAQARAITVELTAPAPVVITADVGELEIILNNLLSNAVKYNRDGGHVTARVFPTGHRAVIAVTDTGIGLVADDAARLFTEFVRIKNEATRLIPGTGLGLSIVRRLAHVYGGDATVESEPGVGSTFTVTLATTGPVEPAADAPTPALAADLDP